MPTRTQYELNMVNGVPWGSGEMGDMCERRINEANLGTHELTWSRMSPGEKAQFQETAVDKAKGFFENKALELFSEEKSRLKLEELKQRKARVTKEAAQRAAPARAAMKKIGKIPKKKRADDDDDDDLSLDFDEPARASRSSAPKRIGGQKRRFLD